MPLPSERNQDRATSIREGPIERSRKASHDRGSDPGASGAWHRRTAAVPDLTLAPGRPRRLPAVHSTCRPTHFARAAIRRSGWPFAGWAAMSKPKAKRKARRWPAMSKRRAYRGARRMVEAGGIEPPSEEQVTSVSTSVACVSSLAARATHRQVFGPPARYVSLSRSQAPRPGSRCC